MRAKGHGERAYVPAEVAVTMSPRFFVAALLVAMFLGQSTGTVLTYDHGTANAANGRNVNVKISEILVSASSESYNGTDWNNDGDIGSSSDQFIELWNAGSEPVDVSDWLLDDVTDGGSAPCSQRPKRQRENQ